MNFSCNINRTFPFKTFSNSGKHKYGIANMIAQCVAAFAMWFQEQTDRQHDEHDGRLIPLCCLFIVAVLCIHSSSLFCFLHWSGVRRSECDWMVLYFHFRSDGLLLCCVHFAYARDTCIDSAHTQSLSRQRPSCLHHACVCTEECSLDTYMSDAIIHVMRGVLFWVVQDFTRTRGEYEIKCTLWKILKRKLKITIQTKSKKGTSADILHYRKWQKPLRVSSTEIMASYIILEIENSSSFQLNPIKFNFFN